MTYLKTIVNYINSQLEEKVFCDAVFYNRKVVSIAQSLPRQLGEVLQLLPSYVTNDGEARYVGPEDDFDLIVYHRVNNMSLSNYVQVRQFGDDEKPKLNQTSMSLVAFGIRDRLQMTNDELALRIDSAFPAEMPKGFLQQLKFLKCSITTNNIILNDLQVFKEEFQNIEFFLKPEQFLLKINYTIESAYKKECFTKPCNCN